MSTYITFKITIALIAGIFFLSQKYYKYIKDTKSSSSSTSNKKRYVNPVTGKEIVLPENITYENKMERTNNQLLITTFFDKFVNAHFYFAINEYSENFDFKKHMESTIDTENPDSLFVNPQYKEKDGALLGYFYKEQAGEQSSQSQIWYSWTYDNKKVWIAFFVMPANKNAIHYTDVILSLIMSGI